MLASEIFDRQQIENEAMQLIESTEINRSDWEFEPYGNAITSLFEELTASGHLNEIPLGEAEKANRETLKRLLNACHVAQNKPIWLQKYYFYELCEELTIHRAFEAIKNGELADDTMVVTISDYPTGVDDKSAWKEGFRPYSKTGMARSNHFFKNESGIWHRHQEQVSRSHSTNQSSGKTIALLSEGTAQPIGSLEVLSNQLLVNRAILPDGVVTLQQILDTQSGRNIRYGDDLASFSREHAEYHELRETSKTRAKLFARYIDRMISVEKEANRLFDEGLISYEHKLAMLQEEKDYIIDRVCLIAPEFSKEARGEQASEHYYFAAAAVQSGNDEAAIHHIMQARDSRDPMASAGCGGVGTRDQQNSSQEAANILNDVSESINDWRWKDGICVVDSCPTRPAKTKVGPCSICVRCQKMFDRGFDPTTLTASKPNQTLANVLELKLLTVNKDKKPKGIMNELVNRPAA